MLGSIFTGTADCIVNDMGGQGSASTVDEQPVFPHHTASLLLPGFDGLGRQSLFDKLFEIVFERQAGSLRVCEQARFYFGSEIQGNAHGILCSFKFSVESTLPEYGCFVHENGAWITGSATTLLRYCST
jgi:hypothetical protein